MCNAIYLGDAWHGWFHVVGNTYGTWVRGDARGFRTRHHREHVEGDYRNLPPRGVYDALRRCSETSMKRPPVVLSWEARVAACPTLVSSLRHHEVEVVEAVVTAKHYHVLARFPCTWQWVALLNGGDSHGLVSVGFDRHDRGRRRSALDDPPRHYVGIAKKVAARSLSDAGLVAPGGVWAKRCHPIPVADRSHQVEVVAYLRRHTDQGGAVLSML